MRPFLLAQKKDNPEEQLELLTRTEAAIDAFDRKLPKSRAVYAAKADFLRLQVDCRSLNGVGNRSSVELASLMERHRWQAAAMGVTESISELVSLDFDKYLKSDPGTDGRAEALSNLQASILALSFLDFEGLNQALNIQVATAVSALRLEDPTDPAVRIYSSLVERMISMFQESSLSDRRKYFEDISRRTSEIREAWMNQGEQLKIVNLWTRASDGLSLEPRIDDLFHDDSILFARDVGVCLIEEGRAEEAVEIWKSLLPFTQALLGERSWDYDLRTSVLKLHFEIAEKLIEMDHEGIAQPILAEGWKLRAFQFGDQVRIDRSVWPKSGEVPTDCSDSELTLFSRFVPDEGAEKAMKPISIRVEQAEKEVRAQVQLQDGPRAYQELLNQIRCLNRFRGATVTEDFLKQMEDANKKSIEHTIPLVALVPLVVAGWSGDSAEIDDYIVETKKAFETMGIPLSDLFLISSRTDKIGNLWVNSKRSKTSYRRLLTTVWNGGPEFDSSPDSPERTKKIAQMRADFRTADSIPDRVAVGDFLVKELRGILRTTKSRKERQRLSAEILTIYTALYDELRPTAHRGILSKVANQAARANREYAELLGFPEGLPFVQKGVTYYRHAIEIAKANELPEKYQSITQLLFTRSLLTLVEYGPKEDRDLYLDEVVEIVRKATLSELWEIRDAGSLLLSRAANRALFQGRFQDALDWSEEALEAATSDEEGKVAETKITYLYENYAHALLCLNKYEEALLVYRQYWDTVRNKKIFSESCWETLKKLEEAGIARKNVERLRQDLLPPGRVVDWFANYEDLSERPGYLAPKWFVDAVATESEREAVIENLTEKLNEAVGERKFNRTLWSDSFVAKVANVFYDHYERLLDLDKAALSPLEKEALGNEEIVVLLGGFNNFGDRIYNYITMKSGDYDELRMRIRLGGRLDVRDFGEVIAAGKGEPTEEVRQAIEEKYQMAAPLKADDSAESEGVDLEKDAHKPQEE